MSVWTLTYAGVEKSCADWGLTAKPLIRTRDRSPTQFSFRMPAAAPETDIPFAFYPALLTAGSTVAAAEAASRVTIRANRTAGGGGWSGAGYVFVGYLSEPPADVDGNGSGRTVVFSDCMWLLQSTTFQQFWLQNVAVGGGGVSTVQVPISRCVLFMDINSWVPNVYQSVQWQVNQIIAYAAACGIRVAAGTIDYSGWFLNYYHCRAVSCWDALLKCLEPCPDAKVWIDGSTAIPTLHVRTRAALSDMASPVGTGPGPVTLPYRGSDAAGRRHHSSKAFKPRPDLIPPQVVLQYQISGTINGKAANTFINDVYPAGATGQMPFAMVCPIDLTGSSETTETATLDCEPLACVGGSHVSKRAWWASQRGGTQHKLADYRVRFGANVLADATVTDSNGNPINLATYPNRIVSGNHHDWMVNGGTAVVAIQAHITVKAAFAEWDVVGNTPAETDTNGNLLKKNTSQELHFQCTLTNAPAGVTVFNGFTFDGISESPVNFLAQNIYNSRSILDYDGTHEIIDPGLPGVTPALNQIIGHWNVVNFSGGRPEWASANMTVAGTEIDLMTNHIRIEVGPSKHLQPQDWNSMLQFFRYRRVFTLSATRATGYGGTGSSIGLAKTTPAGNTVEGLIALNFQKLIAPDAVDATRTNAITHDASVTQVTVVQQNTATNTVYTTGTIAPMYTGAGAPGPSTLATSAYYRVNDRYLDTTGNAEYICTTAGDKTASVWVAISGNNWQIPHKELDPAVAVSKGTRVYISPGNALVTAGMQDLVAGTTKNATPGIWEAAQAVPAKTGTPAYNVPQLPYPGATGATSGSPLAGDLDGANVFWIKISDAPICF